MWLRARTIVEDASVTEEIETLRQTIGRFDEAYAALQWKLARQADVLGLHSLCSGRHYRLYRQGSDPIARTPSIVVVYWYTSDEVTITGLRVSQP